MTENKTPKSKAIENLLLWLKGAIDVAEDCQEQNRACTDAGSHILADMHGERARALRDVRDFVERRTRSRVNMELQEQRDMYWKREFEQADAALHECREEYGMLRDTLRKAVNESAKLMTERDALKLALRRIQSQIPTLIRDASTAAYGPDEEATEEKQ